jgi:SOS-response transcriptional repressor LexA
MKRRKKSHPKTPGGCCGVIVELAPRDAHGRVGITARQRQVVESIRQLRTQRGFPPTVRELQAVLDIGNPGGVACHLNVLRRKGWVDWVDGCCRTLRIVGE